MKRFGLITTNTIKQIWQRKALDIHLQAKNPVRLFFVIPEHPWVDGGAAVRIAMTAGELEAETLKRIASFGVVNEEVKAETPEESAEQIQIGFKAVGRILRGCLRSREEKEKALIG